MDMPAPNNIMFSLYYNSGTGSMAAPVPLKRIYRMKRKNESWTLASFFSFIPVTFFIAIPLLKVHLHRRKGMPCCFSFHASPSFHCEDSTSQNHIFPAGYIQKRACLQQGRSLHGKILHGNHLNESISVTNTCPSV